jgi:anti-sigma regulatory factor (Ser/Thr protein kinase)
MAVRINLEVPATMSALSTVRLVLGGLGARLGFSLDDLDDLYLGTGELLRSALGYEQLERITIAIELRGEGLRMAFGTFNSPQLLEDIVPTSRADDCLDLCTLLRRTMDEVTIEPVDEAFRVILVRGGREGIA